VAARLGVIADAHANLPALDAALAALAERDCDVAVHAGDAVGIGPHPSEVVARLREARVLCVMGNHDEWAAFGVPDPLPAGMGAAEAGHHRWARDRLDAPARAAIAAWPDELALTVGPAAVTVVHYARTPAGPFDFVPQASAADLARLFAAVPGDAVVFGHDHAAYDCAADGRRLVSPGSLGCHDRAVARALVLSPVGESGAACGVAVDRIAVAYDDAAFLADYARRGVPEGELIRREFLRR